MCTAKKTSRVKPTALLLTTVHWASTTRLALSLAEAGFELTAIAPPEHELHRLTGLATSHPCTSLRSAMAVAARVAAQKMPDILIPCDDRAVTCLHELHAKSRGLARLIESSLGTPAHFPTVASKSAFGELCESWGIPVPESRTIQSAADLRHSLSSIGLPAVLKLDGSWGGIGVRVVRSRRDAESALADIVSWSGWAAVGRKMVKHFSLSPLFQRLRGRIPSISLQRFIDGRPANCATLCRRGEVLAGISVEVLQTFCPSGPATVVRVIDSQAVDAIVSRVVRRLGLSGFVGFDFMLERNTDRAYLLEVNPRPTQISHFSFEDGSTLASILADRLSGAVLEPTAARAAPRIITLFPGELWRDPASPYLHARYHDLPHRYPDFIRAYERPVPADPRSWRGLQQCLAPSRHMARAAGSGESPAASSFAAVPSSQTETH